VDANTLLQRLLYVVPLILSLSVHEWAHAWSAFKLGDDTAARQGRLTLNPLVHIDPIGTLLLPLLGVPFGWAKPVPVNPTRFTRKVTMRTGMMITAAAGPISNLVIALVCAVTLGLMLRFGVSYSSNNHARGLPHLLLVAVEMNVLLALFNMLPVPPLDGSRVAEGLVPYRFRHYWETYVQYARYGILLLMVGGNTLLAGPRERVEEAMIHLIRVIAGFT
jgi:Zn-dependent protease